MIAPTNPSAFFDSLWEGAWSAARELAVLGVELIALPTERQEVELQKSLLIRLLDESVDAIVLLPSHVSELDASIARQGALGRPVITVQSDAPASGRTMFVGPDSEQAGALAAEVLAKILGDRGRILSFPGMANKYHMSKRYQGFLAEMKRRDSKIEELAVCHGLYRIQELAAEVLAENRDIDGVYVGCSEVFQVAEVLQRMGIRVPCVGFNLTGAVVPFLRDGTVSAVIDSGIHHQAYVAVQQAYESATTGLRPEFDWVHFPSSVVLASNLPSQGPIRSSNHAMELLVRQRTAELQLYKVRLEAANARLLLQAETDPLTELLNRRKLEQVLTAELARSQRHGPVSLLMADLNCLKQINDGYGHRTGDHALRAVAKAMRAGCRQTDYCARYGGDEFCVVLPETDRWEALAVADRILEEISHARLPAPAEEWVLSISIGAATAPADATSIDKLIEIADSAMYQAKRIATAAV